MAQAKRGKPYCETLSLEIALITHSGHFLDTGVGVRELMDVLVPGLTHILYYNNFLIIGRRWDLRATSTNPVSNKIGTTPVYASEIRAPLCVTTG